jgi:hypothetical protein
VRSDSIHLAIGKGYNRYEICNMTAKGMRVTHRNGTRMEDSINQVLRLLGPKAAAPAVVAVQK